ncbi:hemicentin-1-like isoform X2 [Hydractinia symbiolongicarpus]|uniref:hemicentin-1-like isoform X2 n=1 Tax=Hydractinia symbiolongicarpus TaxID=13093 RepID=UPI00254AADF4|nr:hemicentin-1-like isoform X2 [Hydractinia symbiolongicarpus]
MVLKMVCTALYFLFMYINLASCQWSNWSPLRECTVTCGMGFKVMTRTCLAQPCGGRNFKIHPCFSTPCQVIGVLSAWSDWSSCQGTCGVGYRSRTRTCSNDNCQGNLTNTEVCNGGCRFSECPAVTSNLNCNFETSCWLSDESSQWIVARNTPSPSTGPDIDHTFPSGCGHFAYYEASGKSSRHEAYLSTPLFLPNHTQYCFTFYVSMYSLYPDFMGSLHVYLLNSVTNEQSLIWENFGVLTNNASHWERVAMVVNFVVGDPNMFIMFKAVRGTGYNSDIAIDDGTLLPGNCTSPTHGNWASWERWSNCSVNCGPGGMRSRYRNCSMPETHSNEDKCVGSNTTMEPCPIETQCPVDGGFGDWSNYSLCSKTCDGGVQMRTRECNNPTPLAGGKDCVGLRLENRTCGNEICPVDGGFGDWTNYSLCSKTCDGGVQMRTRECNNPTPLAGGKDCVGLRLENRTCGNEICPVDGGFGDWSNYSLCSKTCDGGVQMRTRECNNPTPLAGGKDCVGLRVENRTCTNDFCSGATGVAKAQGLVENFLKDFHKTEYPDKSPSGKFYSAIFDIQKAVADEFISVDPSVRNKTVEERLMDLEDFLKVATEGGSIDFARTTLGKGLFIFTKKKIEEGLPMDEFNNATDVYLRNIRDKIGVQNYNQILSSQGNSTLMFVMDTTGSMIDEIAASKAIANSIINATRDFEVDYILSPFNDPGTGPVTYKSEEKRDEFITAISNLRAYGGGDCPELAFKGMLNALDQGPKYGSPMFVFTDAAAKDDTAENIAALKSAADNSFTTITFFINLLGCGGGTDSYKEIASHTSGQIFSLSNEAELLQFADFVASSLSRDTMIASGSAINSQFSVDDRISKLTVSATSTSTAQSITLKDPFGDNVPALTTLSMIRIFQIDNPASGVWSLVSPSVGADYKYTVEAKSNDAIVFTHNFMYQENPANDSLPYSLYNPITGVENQLIIRLGGVHRIDITTIQVDIMDLNGNVLMSNLSLSGLEAGNNVLRAMFTPPAASFRVRLTGQTNSGAPIERLSRGISRATNVFVRPVYAGDEFTVSSGQTNVVVQVQALVFGSSQAQLLTITAKARWGTITNTKSETITNIGYVNLIYNAPTDMRGKTDVIRVTVTNTQSREESTNFFSILMK